MTSHYCRPVDVMRRPVCGAARTALTTCDPRHVTCRRCRHTLRTRFGLPDTAMEYRLPDRIPCDACGLPVVDPPEGSGYDARLCDRCAAAAEAEDREARSS